MIKRINIDKIAILGLLWLLCACQTSAHDNVQKEDKSAKDSSDIKGILEPSYIKVAKAKKESLYYTIYSNGKILSNKEVELAFAASGIVQKIHIKNGDFVTKGQLLVSLDDNEVQLRLRRAREEHNKNDESYRSSFIDFDGGIGDGVAIPDTLKRLLKIRHGLFISEIAMEEAERALENRYLKAPFSGRVADLYVSEGKQVSASTPICYLYADKALEVETFVSESDVHWLKKGMPAEVRPLAGNETYKAQIADINPKVEKQGLVRLRLRIINPEGLLQGMNVKISMQIPQPPQLLVPKEAIVMRSDREVVFTYENGKAMWNYIEKGKENSQYAEVLDGLEEGAEVIISNNLQLSHEARVKKIEEE
ncbi:MAG: efflux RND transporter periplasmic adaptor subunit [Bernardetiaceae bacterium]|nr:efflux RND transporter periplasmic adaptor subunit [Bernardetiaceae bacterium]